MESVLQDFFKGIGDSYNFLNSIQTLEAIWLPKSIQIEGGKTMRLTRGQRITIVLGQLVDTMGDANFEIEECRGTQYHSFSLIVKDLKTGEESVLNLPNA